MKTDKNKKSIVITGSSRGIGFGLAKEFLKRNHFVVLNGRSKENLEIAYENLKEFKKNLVIYQGNITEVDFPDKLFSFGHQHFGKIDIWINNAGINQDHLPSSKINYSEVENILTINLLAVEWITISVFNRMQEQGFGKIFNMEGLGSKGRIIPKTILYGTSKCGLAYFTKGFAREINDSKVQVGIVSPGMVATDFIKNHLNSKNKEDAQKIRKIYNILGDKVEAVTPFLVKRILESNKNYNRIEYLDRSKIISKFITGLWTKRDIIE